MISSRFLKGYPRLELLEVITVGLPFCGFKFLTGLFFTQFQNYGIVILGFALMILGTLDLAINLVNCGFLFYRRTRAMDACLFAVFSRIYGRSSDHPRWAWQDFGNSADMLLSFILVAYVVGFGVLKVMPAEQVSFWNICVVLNVLGAGLSRFGTSLKKLVPGL